MTRLGKPSDYSFEGIKDKETRSTSVPVAGEATVTAGSREIVHRGDDRPYGAEADSMLAEETIEGDAIFNNEDIAGRRREFGNIHDADEPSYKPVGGSEPAGSRGRFAELSGCEPGTALGTLRGEPAPPASEDRQPLKRARRTSTRRRR